MIKVGDKVKVVKPGHVYSTFDTMFRKMGFRYTEHNPGFERNTEATVFSTCHHPSANDTLVGIRDEKGNECLIGHNGLMLISTSKSHTVDEDFLMEAYESACYEWKKKLKVKFPEVFKNKSIEEAVKAVGDTVHGYKVEIVNDEILAIPLPNANKKWTLATFDYVKKFIKEYPNSFPIHDPRQIKRLNHGDNASYNFMYIEFHS